LVRVFPLAFHRELWVLPVLFWYLSILQRSCLSLSKWYLDTRLYLLCEFENSLIFILAKPNMRRRTQLNGVLLPIQNNQSFSGLQHFPKSVKTFLRLWESCVLHRGRRHRRTSLNQILTCKSS
jgi:hypothetical protein